MSRAEKLPRWVYRLFNLPRRLVRIGFGQKVGPPLLILTTTGRRSGLTSFQNGRRPINAFLPQSC
jgi:hypothetical protein